MSKIVVVGGGAAGCAAAAEAARSGAQVALLERMEILGGWASMAGVINYPSYCIAEELKLMGATDIFSVLDTCIFRRGMFYPIPKSIGGRTRDLYDVTRLDTELRRHLESIGVDVRVLSRVKEVRMKGERIQSVIADDGVETAGNMFVDATGGTGGMANCRKYGNGCVMCFMRCPAFGDRVSIAAKAGVEELKGKKPDGTIGPTSAGCTMLKDTLSLELRKEIELNGFSIVPVPKGLIDYSRNRNISNSGNIDKGYAENIVLETVGGPYCKAVALGWIPLHELRQIPGLERIRYADPYAGTVGNSIRYMALTPRDDSLKVPGVTNLYVASEKLGIISVVGAIATGVVAGHNAIRESMGMPPTVLPASTMVGYFLKYANDRWDGEGVTTRTSTYAGGCLTSAKERGIYTEDKNLVATRVNEAGLVNIFSQRLAS